MIHPHEGYSETMPSVVLVRPFVFPDQTIDGVFDLLRWTMACSIFPAMYESRDSGRFLLRIMTLRGSR